MKNAIIVHGTCSKEEYFDDKYPSLSNSNWLPWLQKQLLIQGIETATPEVFEAHEPTYGKWLKEFQRYQVTPETILVGHSCGAGFLTRWLSESQDITVGKVVLVAPWLDPDREATTDMFKFAIDSDLASRTAGITIFNSDDDMPSVQTSVKIIREAVQHVGYRKFHSYGHFCMENMHTDKFPALLEEILG